MQGQSLTQTTQILTKTGQPTLNGLQRKTFLNKKAYIDMKNYCSVLKTKCQTLVFVNPYMFQNYEFKFY